MKYLFFGLIIGVVLSFLITYFVINKKPVVTTTLQPEINISKSNIINVQKKIAEVKNDDTVLNDIELNDILEQVHIRH